jgi:diguanylate cyclase (GGDEF)-like protein
VLAGLGVAAYGVVLYTEAIGLLPYAPAVSGFGEWRPDPSVAWRAVALLLTLVAVSTLVAERITKALHQREDELTAANAQLEELSQRDPLTQLYNRRELVRRLEQELERVRRGHPLAVLMIDLDRFKHINDLQGHLVGDELLRRVAKAVQSCTRAVDVSGRFGGDEFVVTLTDTEEREAKVVAHRLVEAIRQIGTEFDPNRPVTASIGISIARPQDDVTVLVNSADESAYRAKSAGGDRYYVQDPDRNSAQFESGPRSARTG